MFDLLVTIFFIAFPFTFSNENDYDFFSFDFAVELCFNFYFKQFLFLLEKDRREIFSGSDGPPYTYA